MIDSVFDLPQLEVAKVFTLLGIRFWDLAQDALVRDGLVVKAWPETAPALKTTACQTPAGIYAFHDIPGFYELEHPSEGVNPWDVTPTRFVVETIDPELRYLPLVFSVEVPFKGVFPTAAMTSPHLRSPSGCYLFSAATRRVPPGLASIRASLLDLASGQPAANAIVEIQVDGQTWCGISDDRGGVAIFLPYPEFVDPTSLSSPLEPVQQVWDVRARVRYDPDGLLRPAGSDTPTILSIFSQESGFVWPDDGGPSGTEVLFQLVYGEPLVIRTAGQSHLWLSTDASPL
jgi:hypothetical protein